MTWIVKVKYADGTKGEHPMPYVHRSSALRAAARLSKTGGIVSAEAVQR